MIATIEQRLSTLGLTRPLIGELVEGIKNDVKLDDGWHQAISLLASRIEVLTDAEQIGLRVKAFIGGSGAERAVAIQQSVAGALREFAPNEVAVISMLSDPSSVLCRYCHEQ